MKYTLFTLNLVLQVLSQCPVLNIFKYKNNLSSNISSNISSNLSSDLSSNSNLSSNGNLSSNSNLSSNISSNISSNFLNETEYIDGKATFYFRINDNISGCPDVQTFNDGNNYGPCEVQYNLNSKYWCAIKNAKDHCGKSVIVYYKGKQINLKVMDECPSCNNNIDMSLEALVELTGSKENACAINQQLPDIKWKILL